MLMIEPEIASLSKDTASRKTNHVRLISSADHCDAETVAVAGQASRRQCVITKFSDNEQLLQAARTSHVQLYACSRGLRSLAQLDGSEGEQLSLSLCQQQ